MKCVNMAGQCLKEFKRSQVSEKYFFFSGSVAKPEVQRKKKSDMNQDKKFCMDQAISCLFHCSLRN